MTGYRGYCVVRLLGEVHTFLPSGCWRSRWPQKWRVGCACAPKQRVSVVRGRVSGVVLGAQHRCVYQNMNCAVFLGMLSELCASATSVWISECAPACMLACIGMCAAGTQCRGYRNHAGSTAACTQAIRSSAGRTPKFAQSNIQVRPHEHSIATWRTRLFGWPNFFVRRTCVRSNACSTSNVHSRGLFERTFDVLGANFLRKHLGKKWG